MDKTRNIVALFILLIVTISSSSSFCTKKTTSSTKDKICKIETRCVATQTESHNVREDIKNQEVDQCMICLGPMLSEETTEKTKCNHIFHKGCLERSFSYSQKCPICRTQLHENVIERDEPETIILRVPYPIIVPYPAVLRIRADATQEEIEALVDLYLELFFSDQLQHVDHEFLAEIGLQIINLNLDVTANINTQDDETNENDEDNEDYQDDQDNSAPQENKNQNQD